LEYAFGGAALSRGVPLLSADWYPGALVFQEFSFFMFYISVLN
jgi:hypothetical protein